LELRSSFSPASSGSFRFRIFLIETGIRTALVKRGDGTTEGGSGAYGFACRAEKSPALPWLALWLLTCHGVADRSCFVVVVRMRKLKGYGCGNESVEWSFVIGVRLLPREQPAGKQRRCVVTFFGEAELEIDRCLSVVQV
jgi:hypothetical protein